MKFVLGFIVGAAVGTAIGGAVVAVVRAVAVDPETQDSLAVVKRRIWEEVEKIQADRRAETAS